MSWLFSRALVAEYSGESSSGGEPSAPLNLMPTPRPFLLSDKTMAFSSPSQFGLTCRPLTAGHGAGVLMSFLEAFPARTSVQPARELGLTESSQDCGWKWPASFVKYDRDSLSWRTRQCSLLGGLELFSETWPRWGSMRDGECSALPTQAPLISGKESGLWPTPTVHGNYNKKGLSTSSGDGLATAVARYPTPRSTDGDRGGRGDLIQAVRGNQNKHFKMWPTMTVVTAEHPGRVKLKPGQKTSLSQEVNALEASAGPLNPPWVEWLMGWVIGWTDCAPLGMDKFRQWLLSHGAC